MAWDSACWTAWANAIELNVAPLTMFTCALCRATTWPGRFAMSRTGYSVVTRVMFTFAIRPPWTVKETWTSPRRLRPTPVYVPSLKAAVYVGVEGAPAAGAGAG